MVIQLGLPIGSMARRTFFDFRHPLRQTFRPVAAAVEAAQGALSLSTRRSGTRTTAHVLEMETHTSSRSASDIVGYVIVDTSLILSRVRKPLPKFVRTSIRVRISCLGTLDLPQNFSKGVLLKSFLDVHCQIAR